MQRFRSMKRLQKFSSTHAQFFNHFNQERHLVTRMYSNKDVRPRWPTDAFLPPNGRSGLGNSRRTLADYRR